MNTCDYFTAQNVLWFPISLNTNNGKKTPQYSNIYNAMPKSTDYETCTKEEIIARQKKKTSFKYGAVDLSKIKHIDVDFRSDKEYKKEEVNFVENCKINFPYFLSSTKQQPHFFFKGNCGKKKRIQTKYSDIEILNEGWSFFLLDGVIHNDIEIPDYNIFEDLVIEKKQKKVKVKKCKSKKIDEGYEEAMPLVKGLLNCINNSGASGASGEGLHYDDYTRIIWSLKNDSENNYNEALNFSKLSSKHELTLFNKIWSETREGNTLGTVHFYAKEHNPKEYRKLLCATNVDGSEESLTNLFMNIEGENLVLSNSNVFIYKNEWIQDDKKTNKLKYLIRKTMNELILNKLLETIHIQETNLYFQKIHNKITMKKTIDNIAGLVIQNLSVSCKNVVFDTSDSQLYNLNFKNGIYDLQKKKFRKRTKYDYITKILNWNYNPIIDSESYNEVCDFFRRLQADEGQRKFTLSWLAQTLNGNLDISKFKMNIGYTAENGKSTEFSIHEFVFDIYTFKLSANFFSLDNSKRHKELINLINNPIRFCYIEELKQNKLDGDFMKEFADGKVNCEILYANSISSNIQATLSTCANKDCNIEMDKGVSRRGIIQYYCSEFKDEYTEDNYEKNTFKKVLGYKNQYKTNDKLKNAYFKLLLEHYDNFKIPKYNEDLFNDIAAEYDDFGEALNGGFEITKDDKDRISKAELVEAIHSSLKISWRKILTEMKNRGITYDKNTTKKGVRGVFKGIKIIKTIHEGDEEESDEED